MNENEFEYGGKRYKASECINYCQGCAFNGVEACFVSQIIPKCLKEWRLDSRDVIFVEVKCE